MSTAFTHPGPETRTGAPMATATAAAAVIALTAAIAGAALLAGIAAGSAIEAPAREIPMQGSLVDRHIAISSLTSSQTGGGYLGPLHID